jgi:hypothetical protein
MTFVEQPVVVNLIKNALTITQHLTTLSQKLAMEAVLSQLREVHVKIHFSKSI